MPYQFRSALIKALIVLIPSYSVAALTEKMVYVVPMLAACGIVASSVDFRRNDLSRKVDDDVDDGSEDGPDHHNKTDDFDPDNE